MGSSPSQRQGSRGEQEFDLGGRACSSPAHSAHKSPQHSSPDMRLSSVLGQSGKDFFAPSPSHRISQSDSSFRMKDYNFGDSVQQSKARAKKQNVYFEQMRDAHDGYSSYLRDETDFLQSRDRCPASRRAALMIVAMGLITPG